MKQPLILFLLIFMLLFVSCKQESIKPEGVKHPGWSVNKTIYELNIRQFSTSGTFKAIEPRLVALKDIGVGIIWLMPVHPIGELKRKGTLGSPYSVQDYYAVNPEYGTMDDFKSLVNKIHEMGMYVIIDWVANHTSWDNKLIELHPDFYTKDSLGNNVYPNPEWEDTADLNYDNPAVWSYMINAMKYWVEETDIDGFRCDVAEMVPLEFWNQARKELDAVKPVFMLAEGSKPELHLQAFDASYSWNLFHLMNRIAAGKSKMSALDSLFSIEKSTYPENAILMRFTTNHDENYWNGTVFERLGDGAKAFAVLTGTIPGTPLLYSGQEAGMTKRLDFYEKDPIEWHINKFRPFYARLFRLHQKNLALFAGSFDKISNDNEDQVYSFIRQKNGQKVAVVLNLSAKEVNVNLKSGDLGGQYREYFSSRKTKLDDTQHLALDPWEYKVYVSLRK